MDNLLKILNMFIVQAQQSDFNTAIVTTPAYKEELRWSDLRLRTQPYLHGLGLNHLNVPYFLEFHPPEMAFSKGFHPKYIYYKGLETLILSYGISDYKEYETSWPREIMKKPKIIAEHLGSYLLTYGYRFVLKAYKIVLLQESVQYFHSDSGMEASEEDIKSDLSTILEYYKK